MGDIDDEEVRAFLAGVLPARPDSSEEKGILNILNNAPDKVLCVHICLFSVCASLGIFGGYLMRRALSHA